MPLPWVWLRFISSLANVHWPWSINCTTTHPETRSPVFCSSYLVPSVGWRAVRIVKGTPSAIDLPQGEMRCSHQPHSLTLGTSSKKNPSPLNFNLVSSLGKRSLPNVIYIGCSDKKQTRCLQHERERPHLRKQKSQGSRGSPSNTTKWDLTHSERSTFISQKSWQVPPTCNVLHKCCSDRTVSLPAGNVKYSSRQPTFPDFQYCPLQQMPIPSSI